MVTEQEFVKAVKRCPISAAFDILGKKWSVMIIRDMFFGKKKFSEFLSASNDLSGKVLSERLKELEQIGLIEKKVVSTTPIKVEYELTEKGRSLDKVLLELSVFSMRSFPKSVFSGNNSFSESVIRKMSKKHLGVSD